MVRRTTWIILVIFVFLAGFAFYFQRSQTNKAENAATTTPTTPPTYLYSLANAKLNEIKITNTAGDKIDLYRDAGSSNWVIADIPADQANSFQIESISSQLADLKAQETLTDMPALDSVGLVTPTYTITMTTTDGTQLITYVGSQTAIGTGYYVRVGTGPVAIVDKVVMDDILNLLTNPPLLPTATPEVTPTETVSPTGPASQVTPTP